jgi:hypothetical protein
MIEIKHALLVGFALTGGSVLGAAWAWLGTLSNGTFSRVGSRLGLQVLLCMLAGVGLQLAYAWLVATRGLPASVARGIALTGLGLAYGLVLLINPAVRLRAPVLGALAGLVGSQIIAFGGEFERTRIVLAIAIVAGLPLLALEATQFGSGGEITASSMLACRPFRRG